MAERKRDVVQELNAQRESIAAAWARGMREILEIRKQGRIDEGRRLLEAYGQGSRKSA